MEAGGIPQESWLGWSPYVKLSDVKTKVIEGVGENPHLYGSFRGSARRLMMERPYLPDLPSAIFNVNRVRHMNPGRTTGDFFAVPTTGNSQYNFNLSRDRDEDIRRIHERRTWRF
jgi:hypothetical protein